MKIRPKVLYDRKNLKRKFYALAAKYRFVRGLGRLVLRRGRKRVNFLHIGKTGGTQIMFQLKKVNRVSRQFYFQKRGHSFTLADLPAGELWFASVRDPISRYYSAFYSRKRMGQPRVNNPWTPGEQWAFERFPHANDLAEALSPNHEKNEDGIKAMTRIGHVNRTINRTLGSGAFGYPPPFSWYDRKSWR